MDVLVERREVGGVQYRDSKLKVLHTTSQPTTLADAIRLASTVNSWFDGPGTVKYLESRPVDHWEYKILPGEFNLEGEFQYYEQQPPQ
jgi:hypothetical protein